jgi:hypothetical protein
MNEFLSRSRPPDGTWIHAQLRSRSANGTYCALIALIFMAAQPPSADFFVEQIGEDRPSGAAFKLEADGSVQVGSGQSIAGSHIVAIRRAGAPLQRPRGQPHVLLANGDIMPGKLVSIQNDKLRFAADLGDAVELTLPLTAVTKMQLSNGSASQPQPKPGIDTVALSNGDSITGTITSLTADGPLRIESNGQVFDVPRDRIESIVLNSELARIPKPAGKYWRMVLNNGARLSLVSVTSDSVSIFGKTLFGETVRFPLAELAVMSGMGGPAVYLSDLKPLRYEHTPYLGVHWPLAVDRSVAGNELRMAGGTFDKGLGLHSACEVTYVVPPNAKRFEALVGLDEFTGRRGAVLLDVKADGRSLQSKPLALSGRNPPRELRLPLPSGCKELTIRVDFGPGGDVQDHVDLADARILVAPS